MAALKQFFLWRTRLTSIAKAILKPSC